MILFDYAYANDSIFFVLQLMPGLLQFEYPACLKSQDGVVC